MEFDVVFLMSTCFPVYVHANIRKHQRAHHFPIAQFLLNLFLFRNECNVVLFWSEELFFFLSVYRNNFRLLRGMFINRENRLIESIKTLLPSLKCSLLTATPWDVRLHTSSYKRSKSKYVQIQFMYTVRHCC